MGVNADYHYEQVNKKGRKVADSPLAKFILGLLKERAAVNDIAADVISGKKKLGEVQILSRGGPGISRKKKRQNKKALKILERRMSNQ